VALVDRRWRVAKVCNDAEEVKYKLVCVVKDARCRISKDGMVDPSNEIKVWDYAKAYTKANIVLLDTTYQASVSVL
jgi:hypothetical protein